MSLDVVLKDGHGSGSAAKITPEGVVSVSVNTHPPVNEEIVSYPFRQFLTSTGVSTGSNDMIVDGSSTPQDFLVIASTERELFIKSISFRIGDSSGVTLDSFGGLSALANGCALCYQNDALGTVVIADELKTNLDLIRLGTSTGAVGTGNAAFKLDVSGGGAEDSYLPYLDLSQTFGFPWGLRLKKGSNDRLFFTINDALAGLVTFNAIAYGTQL